MSKDEQHMLDKAAAVIAKAHDLMDEANAVQSRTTCIWCHNRGYDGDGLKHFDNCVLVEARKLLPVITDRVRGAEELSGEEVSS